MEKKQSLTRGAYIIAVGVTIALYALITTGASAATGSFPRVIYPKPISSAVSSPISRPVDPCYCPVGKVCTHVMCKLSR